MKSNKQQKIVIYGGSFDPPHYAHLDIVKNLDRSFDKVIVVPSYISPFKRDALGVTDDSAARFTLCKKFFASEKTEVSRREISKKGVSYSVDTARYFSEKYKDAKLFWAIGTEELPRLTEWHEIDTLKTLVEFLAVPRPGYPADPARLKLLKRLGIKVKIAKFTGLDVSSTAIKIDRAFGKTNKFMPSAVADAAAKHGMFDPYSAYVDALYAYGLSDKRIEHTYGVALACEKLAKRYGASVKDAVIAGILHDIAKETDEKVYIGKVDTKGFPPPTVHAAIGAYIAKCDFGVSDEIAYAIHTHATASADMSRLGEIVYLADKTEAGRNYKEVYAFRYICENADIDVAMYTVLTTVTDWRNREQESFPCDMTAQAIAHYKALCGGKPVPELPKRARGYIKRISLSLPVVRTSSELDKKSDASHELRVTEKTSGEIRAVGEHDKGVRTVEVKTKSMRAVEEKTKDVRTVEEHDKGVRVVEEHGKSVRAVEEKTESTAAHDAECTSEDVADTVAAELSLHKAHDIDIIDLDGKTVIADYFVIASCSSSTAVKALSDYVEDKLTKRFGIDPSRRDIDREWAALDYGGVIVHIFTDKMREFYNLEHLWSDGKNVKRYGD